MVVVILHNQMSLMVNLTLTKMKIALIPREPRRKDTFGAILVAHRSKGTPWLHVGVNYTFHINR